MWLSPKVVGVVVSSISVRNISESTYLALKDMARKNERSLQEQVRYLLEQEVRLAGNSSLGAARAWRARLASGKHSDTVAMIRGDRER